MTECIASVEVRAGKELPVKGDREFIFCTFPSVFNFVIHTTSLLAQINQIMKNNSSRSVYDVLSGLP